MAIQLLYYLVKHNQNNKGVIMNNYNECWRHLKTAKKMQKKMIKGKLLPGSMDMLAFIGANPDTTITTITKEPYFNDLSLSTVKRCILELSQCRAITSTTSKDDGRIRHLNIMEVN